MALARKIAEFVASLETNSMDQRVRSKLEACLINGYGIALGGRGTPYYRTAGQAVLADSARGAATLLFNGTKVPVAAAAFVIAALFHGRAQEDTCGTVHVGAVVIPMLTAMLETGRYPLDRLPPALLAAYEVSGLFDSAFGRVTAAAGVRATPLYGALGAAAAAGRLIGLPPDRLAAAIANAASFAGGILQSFAEGTDEWRYQAGIAARNGLEAALLAQAGSVSATEAFEGSSGFLAAYVRGDFEAHGLSEKLGVDWSIDRVTFKPYPVCAFNQTPVTAALALQKRVAGYQISAVRVRMNPYETGYPGMDAKGPFKTISGTLMSIPFCIAIALIHGVPSTARMMRYDDPAVNALVDRITLVTDPAVPNLSAIIEVDLPGGTVRQEQFMTSADFSYDRPGVSDLVRRIGEEQGVPNTAYDRLEQFVDRLPSGSISEVVSLFGAPA